MYKPIVNFIHKVNLKYKTEALYFPDKNIYSIRFRGQAIQNFNPEQFYQIPERRRFTMIGEILRLGLEHNRGEKNMQTQIYLNRAQGKKIK